MAKRGKGQRREDGQATTAGPTADFSVFGDSQPEPGPGAEQDPQPAAPEPSPMPSVIKIRDQIAHLPGQVLDIMTGMAGIGCSDADIRRCLGMSEYAWAGGLQEHPEVREMLAQARANGARSVIKSLFDAARAGDIKAAQFWLCNRDRANWQSATQVQVETLGAVSADKAAALVADVSPDEIAAQLERAAAKMREASRTAPKKELLQ